MKKHKTQYIYWFAYYNEDSPSVRYRGKYPLEFINKKYDIESVLIIPSYKLNKILIFLKSYISALFFKKKDSIIIIQRVHSNLIYSNLLKILVLFRRKNTIYDLDDADYLYSPPLTIYWFAKNCNFISAGSTEIKKYLLKYNKNIIITTSPTVDLKLTKKKKSNIFTIGWIGGYGGDHKKSLSLYVFPALNELKFKCNFTILGVTHQKDLKDIKDYFKNNKFITLIIPMNINWKNELDIQNRILAFDIGISTLINNKIQISKSGIKAKQYLNNGIPVIGTDLPENNRVIKHGVNGYFCKTKMEYMERITEFHNMSNEQYLQFSIKCRNSISEFDHDKYYLDLMKINA